MRPDDLDLDQQVGFLTSVLPAPPASVLDAGCGKGALAARLIDLGYRVTAIDVDRDAVDTARRAGVPAAVADFVDFRDDAFDVVLFSRSLHHIHPLDGAVASMQALLEPGGLVVADDFAVDRVDRETAAWFYDTMAILEAAGVLHAHDHIPPAGEPLERWRAQHREDPPLHSGDAMLAAVGAAFELRRVEASPHLYGYLGSSIEESARGYRLTATLLDIETRRITEGSLVAAGLRFVGTDPRPHRVG